MDSFTIIASVLEQALLAWNHNKRYGFIKRLVKVQEKYLKEFNKPSWSDRHDYPGHKPTDFLDNRVLHDYERELLVLGEEYLARKESLKGV